MKALLALVILLMGSLASAGALSLNDLLGSTGEYKKRFDTSHTVAVGCRPAKAIHLEPRKSHYQVGSYIGGTKFWLDEIVFTYADGSQATLSSGTFLDLVKAHNDESYEVPVANSCLQSITITGRPDCKMSAGRSCSSKSVIIDIYSAQ